MRLWPPRARDVVLIGPLVAAWAYIIVRAKAVAFVHDESISYGIIHGNLTFVNSANNHWLNTFAMKVTQRLFGQSEFALRLPNVLAFALYAVAIAAILWPLRTNARVIGVVLLIGNPFVLEFFSLARGYGLGLAFTTASIAALLRGWTSVAVASGVLAFYASFGALNVTLAVFVVALVVRRQRTHLRPETVEGIIARLGRRIRDLEAKLPTYASVVVGFVAMLPGLRHVKEMQDAGELYVGGNRGFIADTIGSVIQLSSGWGQESQWLPYVEGAVVAVGVLCLIHVLYSRRWDAAAWVGAVFVIAVVGQHVETALFGSLWSMDRAALTYLVPFAFTVVLVVDQLPALRLAPLVSVVSAGLILNLAAQANLSYTTLWKYDETSRAVMTAVKEFEASHGPPMTPWKLLSGFPRQQALDYYRLSWEMTWLLPMTRDPITPAADLFYVDSYSPLLPNTVVVAHFASTNTELRVRKELVTSAASP